MHDNCLVYNYLFYNTWKWVSQFWNMWKTVGMYRWRNHVININRLRNSRTILQPILRIYIYVMIREITLIRVIRDWFATVQYSHV
jgi:hypothetical protein